MIYYTLSEDRDSVWLGAYNEKDSIEYNEDNTKPDLWKKILTLIKEDLYSQRGSNNKSKLISTAKDIIIDIAPSLPERDYKIKYFAGGDNLSFEAVIKNGTVSFNMFE